MENVPQHMLLISILIFHSPSNSCLLPLLFFHFTTPGDIVKLMSRDLEVLVKKNTEVCVRCAYTGLRIALSVTSVMCPDDYSVDSTTKSEE